MNDRILILLLGIEFTLLLVLMLTIQILFKLNRKPRPRLTIMFGKDEPIPKGKTPP